MVLSLCTYLNLTNSVNTHPMVDFFGEKTDDGRVFPKNMRWLVFKVKKRAKNNYSRTSLTDKSSINIGFDITSPDDFFNLSADFIGHAPYSYNWPYDFFSLVELAKVETEINLEPDEKEE